MQAPRGGRAPKHNDPDEERRQQSTEAGPSGQPPGSRYGAWERPSAGRKAGRVAPEPQGSAAAALRLGAGGPLDPTGGARTSQQLRAGGPRELLPPLSGAPYPSAATARQTADAAGLAAQQQQQQQQQVVNPFGLQFPASTGGAAQWPATVDELRELGFPVFSAQAQASSSAHLPVAYLVLETLDETLETAASRLRPADAADHQQHQLAQASSSHGGGPGRGAGSRAALPANNLVPVHVNAECADYFSLAGPKDYVQVIRKLLQRDPLLTFAVQKALRHLKQGEPRPVSHVTPDPSGQTSTLFGMRITPCVWEEPAGAGGRASLQHVSASAAAAANGGATGTLALPALLVEHNTPYNAAEVMPRLMRDYAVLSHVPAILTLIDFAVRDQPGARGAGQGRRGDHHCPRRAACVTCPCAAAVCRCRRARCCTRTRPAWPTWATCSASRSTTTTSARGCCGCSSCTTSTTWSRC